MRTTGLQNCAGSLAWEQKLKAAFGSVELVGVPKTTGSASLHQIRIANLTLIEAVSDSKVARRTSRNIASDDDDYFILILVRAGCLNIRQLGRECQISSNMSGLFHLGSPSSYSHHEKTDVIDLKIPASVLHSYIRDPHRYVAIPRAADRGIGRVTADLLQSLSKEASFMPEWAINACAGQLMRVVTTAIECLNPEDLPVDNSGASTAIFKRASAFIDLNAGDVSLDSTAVARSLGISLRYLQRVFQCQGLSVADFIRDCRLKRCHENLLRENSAHDLIKEIAFKGGFRSAAHFSTIFKRRYGVSPGTLRNDPDSIDLMCRTRNATPSRLSTED